MSTTMLELAKQKRDEAERARDELQAALEKATRDAAEWGSFVAKAEALSADMESSGKSARKQHSPPPSQSGKLTLQKDSWGGMAYSLIRQHGPMTLKHILEKLESMGKGTISRKFRNVVFSAMWRRLDDVFIKGSDKKFSLRTQEVELID